MTTVYDFKKISDLSRDNCFVQRRGYHGTATAGAVTYLGVQFPTERYLDSAELILNGHVVGDRYTFDLTLPNPVTPNDLTTDIVLWSFGVDLAVKSDICGQGQADTPYLMYYSTDKRLRLKYTSTGGANVSVSMHFRTHVPRDIVGL